MRNEKEVINQLLDFAKSDERVRAVILNGSRVNPNAPKDIFNDYDVVFAVTDPEYFLNNRSWIEKFGDLIVMQQNDCCDDGVSSYIFLMIFSDGIRIDLSFFPIENIAMQYEDSLKVLLLDKDNVVEDFGPPNDSFYLTKKPSKVEFDKITNEFWWCSTNIAKGLWRDELPYAKYMFDAIVRECILDMVSWYIAMNHNWNINSGKFGKWFKRYLPEDIWQSVERTYAGNSHEEIWDSLLEACRLVGKIGKEVGDHLGYNYPIEDDRKVTEYLNRVRQLPMDAKAINK